MRKENSLPPFSLEKISKELRRQGVAPKGTMKTPFLLHSLDNKKSLRSQV